MANNIWSYICGAEMFQGPWPPTEKRNSDQYHSVAFTFSPGMYWNWKKLQECWTQWWLTKEILSHLLYSLTESNIFSLIAQCHLLDDKLIQIQIIKLRKCTIDKTPFIMNVFIFAKFFIRFRFVLFLLKCACNHTVLKLNTVGMKIFRQRYRTILSLSIHWRLTWLCLLCP